MRQVAHRFAALPPEAPIWGVLEAEEEQDAHQREVSEVEAALAPFKF